MQKAHSQEWLCYLKLIIPRHGRARFASQRFEGRGSQFLILVLELVQAVINSALGEQLLVRTLLAQSAFVEYENAIGVLDGAEAVRDDQRGAAFEQAIERLANQHFRFCVHAGRGFVEDQEARIVRQSARES